MRLWMCIPEIRDCIATSQEKCRLSRLHMGVADRSLIIASSQSPPWLAQHRVTATMTVTGGEGTSESWAHTLGVLDLGKSVGQPDTGRADPSARNCRRGNAAGLPDKFAGAANTCLGLESRSGPG